MAEKGMTGAAAVPAAAKGAEERTDAPVLVVEPQEPAPLLLLLTPLS